MFSEECWNYSLPVIRVVIMSLPRMFYLQFILKVIANDGTHCIGSYSKFVVI